MLIRKNLIGALMLLSLVGCAHTASKTPRAPLIENDAKQSSVADTSISIGIRKVMSVEGDCDSPAASEAAIVELATRYGLFLLKANKMLDNDVYYLAIKYDETKDPPEELLGRFHDLHVKIKPISAWKRGGGLIEVKIYQWNDEVRVDCRAWPLSFNTLVTCQGGRWTLIEPDALGIE